MKFSNRQYYAIIVLTIIVLVVVKVVDIPIQNKISSGIISFELAKTFDRSQALLQSWDTTSQMYVAFSLGFDYLFIVFYTLFFVITTQRLSQKLGLIHWKKLLITMFIAAGIFDVFEDIFLFKILTGSMSANYPLYAYYFAVAKFGLIAIGLIILIVFKLKTMRSKLS